MSGTAETGCPTTTAGAAIPQGFGTLPRAWSDSACENAPHFRSVTCCPDVTSVPCAASHEQYDADPDALAPVLRRVTLRAVYSDRQLFEVMS